MSVHSLSPFEITTLPLSVSPTIRKLHCVCCVFSTPATLICTIRSEPDELGNALASAVVSVSWLSLLIVSSVGLGYSAARLLYLFSKEMTRRFVFVPSNQHRLSLASSSVFQVSLHAAPSNELTQAGTHHHRKRK